MSGKQNLSRRSFMMRGTLSGVSVAVGLPLLDAMLNDSGTAYAATLGGGPLPQRFGTWFWGCGMIPGRWQPQANGAEYDLPPQLAPVAPIRDKITVLSGYDVMLDGRGNLPHISGNTALRTGAPSDTWQAIRAPTFDVLIADAIGGGSFFRSLDLAADGDPRTSYSFRNGTSMNAAIPTPYDFYQKIFGTDFHDPNKADFTPDPQHIVRRSVLSAVGEQRKALLAKVGSADRERLDQYFTSVREMEGKLELQLQKPPPAEACALPPAVAPPKGTIDFTDMNRRRQDHKLMAELLAMALACNQTKVFNLSFSAAASNLRQAGDTTGYHQITHEEPIDRMIGYQPRVDEFATYSMECWVDFVQAMANVREGAGTLLDNMLVFAHSEVSYAKNHDVTGIPAMLAGRAGGKVKNGIHVNGAGEPITRLGLTMQQLMGMPVERWGLDSMETDRPVGEILA